MLDPDTTKLTFAACVSFYNDARALERLLHSVAGCVEYCFLLDGRYDYIKDEDDEFFKEPLSTDGSRDVANWFRDQNAILIDAPDMREPQKRQRCTEIAGQYGVDCILILDSDEFVWHANWTKFRLDAYKKIVARDKALWNIYNIECRDSRSLMGRPRLWFKPWEISYGLTHYEFYRRDDPLRTLISIGGDDYHAIDGLLVWHDPSLRDIHHLLAKQRWETAQQKVEDQVEFGPDLSGLKTIKHSSV